MPLKPSGRIVGCTRRTGGRHDRVRLFVLEPDELDPIRTFGRVAVNTHFRGVPGDVQARLVRPPIPRAIGVDVQPLDLQQLRASLFGMPDATAGWTGSAIDARAVFGAAARTATAPAAAVARTTPRVWASLGFSPAGSCDASLAEAATAATPNWSKASAATSTASAACSCVARRCARAAPGARARHGEQEAQMRSMLDRCVGSRRRRAPRGL